MANVRRAPDAWDGKREAKIYFQVTKRRWIGIDWDVWRLEIISGRREPCETLLAKRNRHHNLLEDNPSAD